MTNLRLIKSVRIMKQSLDEIFDDVSKWPGEDYSIGLKERVLKVVGAYIEAEKEDSRSLDYDSSFGTKVLNATLPLTHSLSVSEAKAKEYKNQPKKDITTYQQLIMQPHADVWWAMINCIQNLEELVKET